MSKQDKTPKDPSFKRILADVNKVFNMQLQTFFVQFVENTTQEQLEAMIPDDVGECDEWIEEHVAKFTEEEEPTVDEMVAGLSAIFMMAFMEKLFDHSGIERDDEGDGDGEGDGDNSEL